MDDDRDRQALAWVLDYLVALVFIGTFVFYGMPDGSVRGGPAPSDVAKLRAR
jgi:hypothetical protein